MQQTSWVPLTVVGLLAAMTFWLGKVADTQLPGNHGGFSHDPDYVVENFAALAFNEQGGVRYRLLAKKMVHYMDDDSSELLEPRFERENGDAARLSVSSKRGLVTAEGENVYFLGDVRVNREATPGRAAMELATEYVRLMPDDDILRTDKAITLRQGSTVIEAAGLFVDNQQRYVQLAGRVKAVYEKKR
jgi:lipopolysaccharide export system protein LptC